MKKLILILMLLNLVPGIEASQLYAQMCGEEAGHCDDTTYEMGDDCEECDPHYRDYDAASCDPDDPCNEDGPNYDPAACDADKCNPSSENWDPLGSCDDLCNSTSPGYNPGACQESECNPNSPNYNANACDINNDPCNPYSPNYDINANCGGNGDNGGGGWSGGGWGGGGTGGGTGGGGGGSSGGSNLYRDYDNDGWGDWSAPYSPNWASTSDHWVTTPGDHNDFCHNISNDPNQCPQRYYRDADGDGWGDITSWSDTPQPGYTNSYHDVDDNCYSLENTNDQCWTNSLPDFADPNSIGTVMEEFLTQNRVDLIEPDVFQFVSTPRLIAFNEVRGDTNNDGIRDVEDTQWGTNGNTSFITKQNLIQQSNAVLFDEMTSLMERHAIGELQEVGYLMINRFRSNQGGQFQNPTLNSNAFNSKTFNNFMLRFGSNLNKALAVKGGNIDAISPINLFNSKPSFSDLYHNATGLKILVNDTEYTAIHLEKFDISDDGVWKATFIVNILDTYGVDIPDIERVQWSHDGFPAWWLLQHVRNYKPFKTVIKIRCALTSKIKL